MCVNVCFWLQIMMLNACTGRFMTDLPFMSWHISATHPNTASHSSMFAAPAGNQLQLKIERRVNQCALKRAVRRMHLNQIHRSSWR
jgi:hypothetical protein